MSTPKTWAANVEPTPEQFAVWLQDATHEERVQHATKALDLSARAHDCLTRNHEALLDERNHWIGEAHRYKRLFQARDEAATRWFKRMKAAEAALDAASAPVSAQQDHNGTEGQQDDDGTLYAPPLPLVQSGGTAWTEQDWWHTTADQRWGEDQEHTPIDDAWAKCWAYIEERHLSPRECQIVWPIANAVMHSILPTKETQ